MNGYEYILAKQLAWAANRRIALISSKGAPGRKTYVSKVQQNLFQNLLPSVKKSFMEGDGRELGSSSRPGKMQAVHSSSALGVNVFHYWKTISQPSEIAAVCGFCKVGSGISTDICFEEKFPINSGFSRHPNIDIVFHNKPSAKFVRFAIECKFSEAYGSRQHSGLKAKYLKEKRIWAGIPGLENLARTISPNDKEFRYLHAAQLIKHILGLKKAFQAGSKLLYLWYDVPGEMGFQHRKEVEKFSNIAKGDGVKFHSLTYQKLIANLSLHFRSQHFDYVQYLSERYL